MNLSWPAFDLAFFGSLFSSVYSFPILIFGALFIVLLVLAFRGRDDELPHRRPDSAPDAAASPARAPAAVPPQPQAPAPAPAAGTPVILVADDSMVARAKLGRLLQGAGYEVVLAADGVEALEALSKRFFSLLITDLEMPNMDGLELISNVQGSLETEDLPIVAITGHDDLQARVRDVEGLYGLFKKPWNDRDLLKRVSTLAHVRPLRPAASA